MSEFTLIDDVQPAPALEVRAVRKTFGVATVLDLPYFRVDNGSLHALVGHNGSGKSTLIKILTGVYQSDPGGSIFVDGNCVAAHRMTPDLANRVAVSCVHQHPALFPQLTVAENLFIDGAFPGARAGVVNRRALRAAAKECLDRFGIDVEAEAVLGRLRRSEQTMVAIARALRTKTESSAGTLILDEPTATLGETDAQHLHVYLRELRGRGQAIVYVTHRLREIKALCDTVSVFVDGRVIVTKSTSELSEDDIAALVAGQRVVAGQGIVAAPGAPGAVCADAESILLSMEGVSGPSTRDVTLALRAGEVVGITDAISGNASEILQMVFGVLAPRTGRIRLDGTELKPGIKAAIAAGIGYVPPDRAGLASFGELTVPVNVTITSLDRLSRLGTLRRKEEGRWFRDAVGRYGIRSASEMTKMAHLSGGNQQKVVLARWLERKPRVLLLDEPTQGVDLTTRRQIHSELSRLAAAGSAVLVAGTDLEEIAELCPRVIVLRDGRPVRELRGDEISAGTLTSAMHAPTSAGVRAAVSR